jgi:hypothetical protein
MESKRLGHAEYIAYLGWMKQEMHRNYSGKLLGIHVLESPSRK